ncbi:sensor histidine kinase [Streptomyces sp. AM 2-1-1]|uniref:sensor histidine kinase n=1 Tax=Streptomyces sp. AM 2-1-1 TaxID=3028709 RepID=UPI0023B8F902|nr:sensor histidine kinase [Streptomyces sp. AM 2-1-1]WEH42099.1 sensor histidine kinase [Streptomyces sp. AM 2-1-1]
MPWLLLGLGSFSNLWKGETPNPWVGALGVLLFNSCYVQLVFRRSAAPGRRDRVSMALLGAMAVITFGLAIGYGGSWLLFFPLLSLACGTILRGRRLALGLGGLAVCAVGVALWRGDHAADPWTIGYGTFLSGAVTAALFALAETVRELRDAQAELARGAVERERLRFSRDLHDLLGHTLSVIVVKSEAARRLARLDLDAALGQVADIESVGRQALTEVRGAVTGYRAGSLSGELDRALSALAAAGIEGEVHRTGPPLTPRAEALLGWVVREAVTNAVRHSGAARCVLAVTSGEARVRLTVSDDGPGAGRPGRDRTGDGAGRDAGTDGSEPSYAYGGTGLAGLSERLALAGGSLRAAPGADGGFVVRAELPGEPAAGAPVGD